MSLRSFCRFARDERAAGDLTASKLTLRHIRDYIERRKREAANATINRELAIVRRAYNLEALEDPPLPQRTESRTERTRNKF